MILRFGLTETTITKICEVFAKYPHVEKAVLYGSRARGNYKNGSDIDLTLFGNQDLTLDLLYLIMDEIDNLLLPYSFDLSIFQKISDPAMIEHIQRNGLLFYEKRGF